MGDSSVGQTSVSRSKAAVAFITAIAAAYGAYYLRETYQRHQEQSGPVDPARALRRSNAVHHRRDHRSSGSHATVVNDEQPRTGGDGADDGEPMTQAEALRSIHPPDHEEADGDHFPHDDRTLPATPPTPLETNGAEWDDPFASQHFAAAEADSEPFSMQRNGQNMLQLLYRTSEDAARKTSYIHRGVSCNSCGVNPLRGIRWRCANCPDYDLCEACEAPGDAHKPTHIFYKIKVPVGFRGPREAQPVSYSGDPERHPRTLSRTLISRLTEETSFERPEVEAYWEQFTYMANTQWPDDPDDLCLAIDRPTFNRILVPCGGARHVVPNLIHDRMFAFYDANGDGLIGFAEFLHGLSYRRQKYKLRHVFEGYDIDGDGYVDRKDFLRMFRAYYVLCKEIERDVLQGQDDQFMPVSEVEELVTGRQPLSSAFGRDGRFPPLAGVRSGLGKTRDENGDWQVSDGRGVISDNNNDQGTKKEVLMDIFSKEWKSTHPTTLGDAYYAAVANPPPVEDRIREDLESILYPPIPEELRAIAAANFGHEDADGNWRIPIEVIPEDVIAVCGQGVKVSEVPKDKRRLVYEHALARRAQSQSKGLQQTVSAELHKRWQRRQFYTDEEEGLTPPPDWDEKEDVPQLNGKVAKANKDTPPAPMSPRSQARSRSSSKVRFAEDTDDFETRSNVSTSSRSVPERWGGMDIPDAERDAGKEILYHSVQQSLNGMLDLLFKEREDLAIQWMISQEEIAENEKYLKSKVFQSYCKATMNMENFPPYEQLLRRQINLLSSDVRKLQASMGSEDMGVIEVDIEDLRQRSVNELLAQSGYSVEGVDLPAENEIDENEDVLANAYFPHGDLVESLVSAVVREGEVYRDPTLPQFRPNTEPGLPQSLPDTVPTLNRLFSPNSDRTLPRPHPIMPNQLDPNTDYSQPPPPSAAELEEYRHLEEYLSSGVDHLSLADRYKGYIKQVQAREKESKAKETAARKESKSRDAQLAQEITEIVTKPQNKTKKEQLVRLWKLERCHDEAERRGGFARINYEEFERGFKAAEKKGKRLDYLGAWIEFCIP